MLLWLPSNKQWLDKFNNGEMTYDEVLALVQQSAGVDWDGAWKAIEDLFVDTSNISTMLNGVWSTVEASATPGAGDEDKIKLYRLYLLDFFLALDHKLGGALKNEINVYLANLNNDGCDTFVVPVMASVIGVRENKKRETNFSTLPDYYGFLSHAGGAVFEAMYPYGSVHEPLDMVRTGTPNITGLDHKSNRANANSSWFALMEQELKAYNPKVSGFLANMRTMWWGSEQYSQIARGGYYAPEREMATTLYPTDIFGVASGRIGYTYLPLGGGAANAEASGNFRVKVGSAVNVVSKGSTVAANVTVDLKQDDVLGMMHSSQMVPQQTYQSVLVLCL